MPEFIDLFAGCGGFSAGLVRAGWKSLVKVEIDAWAADTLRANFPDSEIVEGDIRSISDEKISKFAGADLVVGGPPCQGFSVAGSTQFGIDDPRNELFYWYLHWVEIVRPKIAIIENVPNILKKAQKGRTVVDAVTEFLSPLGYYVQAQVLNSADFGVPQSRRRAFIVAALDGIDFDYPVPKFGKITDGLPFEELKPYVTVSEAISDLPVIDAGEGVDQLVPYPLPIQNEFQRYAREGSSGVSNHVAMKHTSRLIERFKIIRPGQSLKDVPMEHGQIAKLTGQTSSKPFKYNNYRLDPSAPALTIPASFQSLFLHPERHRNLTAREAARLMGFQDRFEFKGKRTTMSWEKHLSQYNQIGNAVCPPVGEALGYSAQTAISRGKVNLSQPVNAQTRLTPTYLNAPARVPALEREISANVRNVLAELGKHWTGTSSEALSSQGFDIPLELLPAAILIANAECCEVCSPDLAPRGNHHGEICYLISKDDISSLQERGQDHGLDYHLRILFGVEHQVGHLVGELLARFNLASDEQLPNERTGRMVRGMKVRCEAHIPSEIEDIWRNELATISGRKPLKTQAA